MCGEIPSSRATSLLVMPLPRAPSTSISRGVNRTGGSSGNESKFRVCGGPRTYRQPRCDGAQRSIDLSRAGVRRKPAGELSADDADCDGRSRQNGLGGAVGQDRIGRCRRLHNLVPALGNECGEPVLRRRVRRQHCNAKALWDSGRRSALICLGGCRQLSEAKRVYPPGSDAVRSAFRPFPARDIGQPPGGW